MTEQAGSLMEQIRELLVNDFFTPNIKAEVIFDALLTPYIAQIVEKGLQAETGSLTFLTKEMSIPYIPKKCEHSEQTKEMSVSNKEEQFGSMGSKIDYVLVGSQKVYLVELKTTNASVNPAQAENYLKACHGKPFGDILGRQLLSILSKKRGAFSLNLGTCKCSDEMLKDAFQTIIRKPFRRFQLPEDAEKRMTCADIAKELIRENYWTQKKKYGSRKYLYTLGQIVDYLNKGNSLCNKQMEVIYLIPNGGDIETKNGTINSISLLDSMPGPNGEEELVQLLKSVMRAVCPTKKKPSCQN